MPASALKSSLGTRLAPLLSGNFFRPLARPSAAVYIDCADRLVEAADEGGQLTLPDARALIRDVLIAHPNVKLDEDEGGHFKDINQRANQFFNKLCEAVWIQERRPALNERLVLIAPRLRPLLRLLRDLAENRPAELRDFSATLRSLCSELLAENSLDPAHLDPEGMRQKIKDLNERAGRAIDQMHAVETLVEHHEQAQRTSETAKDTLARLLNDFSTGEHMVCYDALQESGLRSRINRARLVVQETRYNPLALNRLAEGLSTHFSISPTEAYAEAEQWLENLEQHLAAIPNKERIIDGRIADFSRLSSARYRYQTEMRGRRPEQVKAWLDAVALAHTGESFAALAHGSGMPLLSPEAAVYYGPESLTNPRRKRLPVDLAFQVRPASNDSAAARDEIRRRNLDVLTPRRAARFVSARLSAKGDRISSSQFNITDEETLLDLLSVLIFDNGPATPGASSLIRWRVHPARVIMPELATAPEAIPRDPQGQRMLERLEIERTA